MLHIFETNKINGKQFRNLNGDVLVKELNVPFKIAVIIDSIVQNLMN